jgi:hypothetical protein
MLPCGATCLFSVVAHLSGRMSDKLPHLAHCLRCLRHAHGASAWEHPTTPALPPAASPTTAPMNCPCRSDTSGVSTLGTGADAWVRGWRFRQ